MSFQAPSLLPPCSPGSDIRTVRVLLNIYFFFIILTAIAHVGMHVLWQYPPGTTGQAAQFTWTISTVEDTANILGTYKSMVIANNTNVLVAYYDATEGALKIAEYKRSGSAVFTGTACTHSDWNCEIVDNNGVVGSYVSMTLTSNGNPLISYYDSTNTAMRVAEYTNGGNGQFTTTTCTNTLWKCDIVDNTSSTAGQYSSIILNSSSTPIISYYDTSGQLLKFAQYVGSGGNCTSSVWNCYAIDSGIGTSSINTALILNSSNQPVISYHDSANSSLKFAEYVGSGGNCASSDIWNCETADNTNDQGSHSSMILNESNNPVISYYDVSNTALKFAEYIGSGQTSCTNGSARWNCEVVDNSNNVGAFTSIKKDSSGVLSISYRDIGFADLRLATYIGSGGTTCSSGSARWDCEIVDSSGDVGSYTALSIDTNRQRLISYANPTNSALKFAISNVPNSPPVVGYTADNVIPTAQVTQATDGTGIVTISFRVKDAESNNTTLNTFQYSVNGGNTFNAPTNGDASDSLYKTSVGSDDWDTNGATGTYSSATDYTGAVHSFSFNALHTDVDNLYEAYNNDVQIQFTVNDGTVNSASAVTSQNFVVDLFVPQVSVTPNIVTRPSAGDTAVTVLVTLTEDNPTNNVYSIEVNNGGYGSVTNGSADEVSTAGRSVATVAALDGDDCVSGVRVSHTDDYGNILTVNNTNGGGGGGAPGGSRTTNVTVDSSTLALNCAIPYVPASPTVTPIGPNQVHIKINANGSETGAVQYAVRVVQGATTQYLQTNGTLATTADWTLTAATTYTLTGLMSSTNYTIDVKARNPSDTTNTETNFSGSGSLQTQADRIPTVEYDRKQSANDQAEQPNLPNDELANKYKEIVRPITLMLVKEDPDPVPRTDRFLDLKLTLTDQNTIQLTWTDHTFPEPKYIEIWRNYTPSRTALSLYTGIEYGQQQYLDANVEQGRAYYYRIKMLNQRNDVIASDILAIKVPGDGSGYVPSSLPERLLDALIGVTKPF